jgi:hypothetical protein
VLRGVIWQLFFKIGVKIKNLLKLSYIYFYKLFFTSEYMFLLAGNIMPGAENLRGELLFPEEKWLFFLTEGRKNSFSKGNKCSSWSFFAPGIMFFSLKDTFSNYFLSFLNPNKLFLFEISLFF